MKTTGAFRRPGDTRSAEIEAHISKPVHVLDARLELRERIACAITEIDGCATDVAHTILDVLLEELDAAHREECGDDHPGPWLHCARCGVGPLYPGQLDDHYRFVHYRWDAA